MMDEDVRIDKWLWAARFFKTRALARQAVAGGKVELNGHTVKPGRVLKSGDRLIISRETEKFEITVQELTAQRRSASLASAMYMEDAGSIERRALAAEQRKLAHAGGIDQSGRPDKRARRKIIDFIRGRK